MIRPPMTEQKPHILVIDNYDSFTWNLVHYVHQAGGVTSVMRNDALSAAEALAQADWSGIILSPGPCTPNEAGICMQLVRTAPPDLPILGICLGHQAIAQACGSTIVRAREIRHGKASDIQHQGGPLFAGLPDRFSVIRYHSLAIEIDTLAETLIADAHTEDGEIMAIRHKTRPVFGLQFHPESLLTEHGHTLLENWLTFAQEHSHSA